MAYDEGLAQRVRERLESRGGYGEKKMFGGLCFLLNGNMTCGIVRDELMARIGPEAWDEALASPEAREMDFTGRSLKGFVYVDGDALADDAILEKWVARAAAFAEALPAK
jgi:TfoX/Sxy family transcriptional regulator of competence genes